MSEEQFKLYKTNRGFTRASFVDRYRAECSIQKSSLADEDCIWLGCDTGNHHHLTGYCSARMHLTREHAEKLIPLLRHFVETGELPEPDGD